MPTLFGLNNSVLPENLVSKIFMYCDTQTISLAPAVNNDWHHSILQMKSRRQIYDELIQQCDFFNDVNVTDFLFAPLQGGLTNTTFKITIKNQSYVARLPGNNTNHFIQRISEYENACVATQCNINAELVYYDVKTGAQITAFLPEPLPMTPHLIKSENYLNAAIHVLKQLHQSNKSFKNDIDIFNRNTLMLDIIHTKSPNESLKYEAVKKEILKIQIIIEALNLPKFPCHNDSNPTNFLLSENKMYLIDWEYSGNNFPVWDLVCLAMESDFCNKDIVRMTKLYYGEATQFNLNLINVLIPVYQYWGALWANVQRLNGNIQDDYDDLRALENQYFTRCEQSFSQCGFFAAIQFFQSQLVRPDPQARLSLATTQTMFKPQDNTDTDNNSHDYYDSESLRR